MIAYSKHCWAAFRNEGLLTWVFWLGMFAFSIYQTVSDGEDRFTVMVLLFVLAMIVYVARYDRHLVEVQRDNYLRHFAELVSLTIKNGHIVKMGDVTLDDPFPDPKANPNE